MNRHRHPNQACRPFPRPSGFCLIRGESLRVFFFGEFTPDHAHHFHMESFMSLFCADLVSYAYVEIDRLGRILQDYACSDLEAQVLFAMTTWGRIKKWGCYPQEATWGRIKKCTHDRWRICFQLEASPACWRAWSKAVRDIVERKDKDQPKKGQGVVYVQRSFKQSETSGGIVEIHFSAPVTGSTVSGMLDRARAMCPGLQLAKKGIIPYMETEEIETDNCFSNKRKLCPDGSRQGSLRKKPARAEPASDDEKSESDGVIGEDPDEAEARLKQSTGLTSEPDRLTPPSPSQAESAKAREMYSVGTLLLKAEQILSFKPPSGYKKFGLNQEVKVDYQDVLGWGSYGVTYGGVVRHKLHDDKVDDVAIKIYEGAKSYSESARMAREEVASYAALGQHPNLLTVWNVHIFDKDVRMKEPRVGLVFCRFDEDLFNCCRRRAPLTSYTMRRIMKCLLSGLKFMHDSQVLHADLKTSNVLLRSKGTITIDEVLCRPELADSLEVMRITPQHHT